jgi:tRNA-specific 2-thiouridylase
LFLSERAPLTPGTVIEAETNVVVGTVTAVELVTVGQKQGFGLDAKGRRRVVISSSPSEGTVTVAPLENAMIATLAFQPDSVTWTGVPVPEGTELFVQMRSHGAPARAVLREREVEFVTSVTPVAPGQTVAFYSASDPDLVLGSARVVS